MTAKDIDKKITGEESEAEEAAEETQDDESAEEHENDSEDGDESDKSSSTTEELDLDVELENERKNGAPDPVIAADAFKDRKKKREEDSDEGDDEKAAKPLTQADLDAFEAKIRKDSSAERALELAKEMAGSDKEAQLIVAKWQNRTFPKNLSLREQIAEAYVITHSKRLIGERNEAMRALKGKQGVRTETATTYRDATKGSGNEPKISAADAGMLRASGFAWSNTNRQYEKKLPNGRILVRDTKTNQVRLLPKK